MNCTYMYLLQSVSVWKSFFIFFLNGNYVMISHSFILTALVRPLVTEAFWRYPVEKPQTSAHSTGFLLKMF